MRAAVASSSPCNDCRRRIVVSTRGSADARLASLRLLRRDSRAVRPRRREESPSTTGRLYWVGCKNTTQYIGHRCCRGVHPQGSRLFIGHGSRDEANGCGKERLRSPLPPPTASISSATELVEHRPGGLADARLVIDDRHDAPCRCTDSIARPRRGLEDRCGIQHEPIEAPFVCVVERRGHGHR